MYELTYDPETCILHPVLWGYWTIEIFERFSREIVPFVERLMKTQPVFRTLSDVQRFEVQGEDVRAGLARIAASDTFQSGLGPVAILTRSALTTMQVRRTALLPNVRMFGDRAAAMDWLMAFELPAMEHRVA